jgi:hypothetical protein
MTIITKGMGVIIKNLSKNLQLKNVECQQKTKLKLVQ